MFYRRAAAFFSVATLLSQTQVLSAPLPPVVAVKSSPAPVPASAEKLSVAHQQYGQLPVSFEPNVGQAPAAVRFLARTGGYRVALLPTEALFAFQSATPGLTKDKGKIQPSRLRPKTNTKTALVQMQLLGANSQAQLAGIDALPGKVNYLKGNDPSQWHTDVATYARVESKGVYPGVDLIYHSEHGQLEYDFVVAPKADPSRIRLRFSGAQRVFIDKQGGLVVNSEAGQIRQLPPVINEYGSGSKRQLQGRYVQLDAQTVGFAVQGRRQDRTLIIDPVLSYSTYLGGDSDEYGYAVAVDGGGNAYVTGQTASTNFPSISGSLQTQSSGGIDTYVAKLNAAGTALVYSTYLGGGNADYGRSIAVDNAGNAYVTGFTNSTNFPTTPGALQTQSISGGFYFDAFVAKLNAAGAALVYSTYLGGRYDEFNYDVAVDDAGNAYVTGYTSSDNFPTTPGALQAQSAGSYDTYVAKLNASGTALVYSTYLGGENGDYGKSLVVDSAGNAYVTGYTDAIDFPTTPDAPQTQLSGDLDVFVSKLNASGTALVYSTYLGGGNTDYGNGIAVDSAGNAYATGYTYSSNFPTTPGARQTKLGGTTDVFVSKLNAAGTALVYSTYLGGSGTDYGSTIVLDGAGNAFVIGETYSTNFPLVNPIYFSPDTANDNIFVSKLNPTGSALAFSTLLKGGGNDVGYGLTVDGAGNAYATGFTASADFPATPGAPQGTRKGNLDAFITKINPSTPLVNSFSPASGSVGTAITLTGTGFSKTSYVYFANGKKAPFTIVSDTQLVVTVPTGATTAKIDVYVPFGKAQSPTAFTVTP
ncbi:SBBP repeat-containing protein [Gloeobacter kilaueensis]|uniref:Uncharacterized protein n=1 Tax=Gloeobacter kilaueensis (strain ATCC BAA-2537 / CCAP 1431/1 / ULC 316 / JS1) TaxID=1183438 RepID=U5QNL5_GLOK1|nr:SBBP repeat-containing protein [Gloeobacter kilaueensis]AGY59189.1 hypothetical protein GKIL_2943 [Gloeobacter kilaueensis JS1]